MRLFVVDTEWSAFEHTLTPLTGGLSNSFLSLAVQNSRSEGLNRDSSVPAVDDVSFSLPRMPQQQVPRRVGNDANGADGSLTKMSPSVDAIVIDDDDGGDARRPSPAPAFSASSQLMSTADNCCYHGSITSTEVRMLRDVNRSPIVNSWQALREDNVRHSAHFSRKKDQVGVNKPVGGKENMRPPSGSQSELSRLSPRNCLDVERQRPRTKNHEAGSTNHWQSPLRLTANTASSDCLAENRLSSRGSCKEPTVVDMNRGFSALPAVFDDSVDCCDDQVWLSEGSLIGRLDEEQVYKRSSSTPVKDPSLQEQQRSSTDQDGGEWGTAAQSDVADPLHAECPAVGALSANSSFDNSVAISDVTYESTVLLPLPTRISADSARIQESTGGGGGPEVGTQTSFLSSTCSGATSRDAGSYTKDKLQHSHDRKTSSRVLTSGNHR